MMTNYKDNDDHQNYNLRIIMTITMLAEMLKRATLGCMPVVKMKMVKMTITIITC